MITKRKKEKKRNDKEINNHASHKLLPPPYISHTISTLPHFVSGSNPLPTSPGLLALMANPHQLPPGNTSFASLAAASSSLLTRSSTLAVHYPQAFTADQLDIARSSLALNPRDIPDFSQDTLSGLITSQTATLTLLSQLGKRAGYHLVRTFRSYPETHIHR